MRMTVTFYNISMYFYNKNVLEYAQIVQNGMESKIPYVESNFTVYSIVNGMFSHFVFDLYFGVWNVDSENETFKKSFFVKSFSYL